MSKSSRLTVLCAVLLLCATAAFGASQNAVLYGTVYDAGGGAISGATVSVAGGSAGAGAASELDATVAASRPMAR